MARRYQRHRETLKWLIKQGSIYSNKQIAQMSKARLVNVLADDESEPRSLIQGIRMGLELGEELGASKEFTMKHVHEIPMAAQDMIARRVLELQKEIPILPEATDANPRSTLPLEDDQNRKEDTTRV